eukprot:scaffold126605_cov17-Tisochrysis_lutea.AAC.1
MAPAQEAGLMDCTILWGINKQHKNVHAPPGLIHTELDLSLSSKVSLLTIGRRARDGQPNLAEPTTAPRRRCKNDANSQEHTSCQGL